MGLLQWKELDFFRYAKAINTTSIQATFNNDPTEANLAVSNFKLTKGTVEANTAKGKVATISVAGLTVGDTPTVTVSKLAFSQQVTVPQVSELYVLEVTTDALTIQSNLMAQLKHRLQLH